MVKSDFNKNIAISVILSFCIFFLWKFGILYSHSLSPVVKEGRLHVFADWAMPIKLAVCHKLGFDIFYPSSCINYPFNYGNILLYVPYFKSFEKFYQNRNIKFASSDIKAFSILNISVGVSDNAI